MRKISKFIEFTPEQKERAAAVDLEEFLLRQGEKLIKSGREKRLASDHSVTVRGCEWFDHASNEGGRAVSFIQKYYGKSYIEAMSMLLGESTEPVYPQAKKQEVIQQKPFAPPVPNTNMHRVFAYLLKTRGLDADVVSYFARKKLLYEDAAHHNAVFIGTDEGGLSHPDWQENLANALKVQALLNRSAPGLCRNLDLRTERFNQHETPGSLLVEVGASGNTLAEALRTAGYDPQTYVRRSPWLGRVLERMSRGYADGESYADLVGGLLYGGDPYLLLADFDDYAATHEKLYAAITDPATRARLSLVNIARSGIFAADRAVREYAERIWEVQV